MHIIPNEPEKFNCRYVMVKDVLYIRAEDVAAWVIHIVETEEVDVRNRFKQAVQSLIKPQVSKT